MAKRRRPRRKIDFERFPWHRRKWHLCLRKKRNRRGCALEVILFMPSEFRQYDEHGFPMAPRFEELTRHDDEPPRRPGFSVRTKRIVVVGLIIGVIVPIVFGPRLMSFGAN